MLKFVKQFVWKGPCFLSFKFSVLYCFICSSSFSVLYPKLLVYLYCLFLITLQFMG